MEQPVAPTSGMITVPPQVWETLTATQQTAVLQTIVRICQEMIEQWGQEEQHEPVAEQ